LPALDAGIFFFEALKKMAGSSPAMMRNWRRLNNASGKFSLM
jgi:hypothetical protein